MTEQVPSKERVQAAMLWALDHGYKHGDAHVLAKEVQRLQTALRGIQSCSTCEACRGAATRVLGEPPGIPAHLEMLTKGAAPEPAVNPFDQAKAVFAGKKGDAFLLKMWFDTQEDLDKAFDVVEGTAQPPVDVRGVDCPACGKPMSEHRGELKPGAVLWCP